MSGLSMDTKEAKEYAKDFPGVEIHGKTIRVKFRHLGQPIREPLKGVPLTKSNIKNASRKLSAVNHAIANGTFDYAEYFPGSKRAIKYGKKVNTQRSIVEGVRQFMVFKQSDCAPSTYANYKVKAERIKRRWPTEDITEITYSDLLEYRVELINSGLSPKTVNEIFIVVRGVWDAAYMDGVIAINPCTRIKNLNTTSTNSTADPFTRDELERIAKTETHREPEVNLVMVACWTGLSTSEIIALCWEDIDLVNWTLTVKRSRVENEYKVPKEVSRERKVELLAPAIEWLKKQKRHTFMTQAQKITVRNRDNATFFEEEVRFVFLRTSRHGEGTPFPSDMPLRENFFKAHLEKAGVRYRGVNQCRHTYASQLLTANVPKEYIASQMGHFDTTMIKKHYAKWIPEDAPSMAKLVNGLLGFENSELTIIGSK